MIETPHPSVWINENVAKELRATAAEAEHNRVLHSRQVDLIHENRWLRLFMPEHYGGIGASLPDALHTEEALAWADGSTAWVVTLCAGAGWFVGFLDPQVANEFVNQERVCFAGSGGITGYAEETPDGYIIRGIWKYASGALHATAFTMNCQLTRNGAQIFKADGSPNVVTVILKRAEVEVKQTWRPMGMIATASHSFEVRDKFVSRDHCFVIDREHSILKDDIYNYPFLQFAETTLAVNLSGMAFRFIDLCEEICKSITKHPERYARFSSLILKNKTRLIETRNMFYQTAAASWEKLQTEHVLAKEMCNAISTHSQQMVRDSRDCVNDLYPHCGMLAADPEREINRVWRNLHTAGQHALFSF
jgi:indole-3-acetate monooxygenase